MMKSAFSRALMAWGVAGTSGSSQRSTISFLDIDCLSSSCSPRKTVPFTVSKQIVLESVVTGMTVPSNVISSSLSRCF